MSDPQEAATPSDPHSAEALDLDAIQKRADAATAGSWWTGMKDGFSYTVEGPEADSHPVAQRLIRPDAEFIVHAHEDVPALVAALRSRDAEVAELKAKIAAVLALHSPGVVMPSVSQPDNQCVECSDPDSAFPVPWPCPTVLALGSASSPVEGGN